MIPEDLHPRFLTQLAPFAAIADLLSIAKQNNLKLANEYI